MTNSGIKVKALCSKCPSESISAVHNVVKNESANFCKKCFKDFIHVLVLENEDDLFEA